MKSISLKFWILKVLKRICVAFVWINRGTALCTHVVIKFYAKTAVTDLKKRLDIRYVQFVEIGLKTLFKFSIHEKFKFRKNKKCTYKIY